MAQALIVINAVTGSNPPNGTPLVINSLVTLDNVNNGGETTYLWEWLDKPEGSLATFSNPNIQSPTFTPDVEGTYLVKLTVNRTLATESVNTAIVGIAQLRTNQRIPAAGEQREHSTSRGWALTTNRLLQLLDTIRGDGGMIVGAAGGAAVRGNLLRVSGVTTIKPGLPGEEIVPTLSVALATSASSAAETLYAFEYTPTGGTSAVLGSLVRARSTGLFGPIAGVGPVAGDSVYLSNTGTPAVMPGTNHRRIGTVAYAGGGNWYFHFNGAAGAGPAAGEPFVFGATPTGSYPNSIDLSALVADLAIDAAADVANIRMTRFSATQTTPTFGLLTELGDPVFTLSGHGDIVLYNPDVDTDREIYSPGANLRLRTSGAARLDGGTSVRLQIGGSDQWVLDAVNGDLTATGAQRALKNLADPIAAQDAATRAYVLANTRSTYSFGNSSIAVAAGNTYLDPGYCNRAAVETSTTNFPTTRATRAGVLRNLVAYVRVGPTNANIELEVLVNGSTTGIKCTFTDGVNDNSKQDYVHTFVVAQGDLIHMRAKPSGVTTGATLDITATVELAGA